MQPRRSGAYCPKFWPNGIAAYFALKTSKERARSRTLHSDDFAGLCISFSIVGLATVGSGPVKVFNEHDFVLAFVVDQFVSNSADQHKSEPSRAESFLLAHNVMGDNTWLAMNGRV